ncbi:MAG: extracellular solute-binding protein [Betaproteobacteria bacterium]|nr:MAG: extracellular solute-binding protein [Betaproteobacteria bacterium]
MPRQCSKCGKFARHLCSDNAQDRLSCPVLPGSSARRSHRSRRRSMRTSAKRIAAVWSSLCVGLVLLGASGAAHCGEQADKAVAAVKLLIARGELKPDAVLRMRVKQGNTSSFLGRDYELQKDWEKQTGILLDVSVMPQVDSLEIIRRSNDIDLTIARNHEYPDLVAGRLIEDLTPLLQRFGFALPVDTNGGYMLLQHQAMVGDRVVAIPADLDMAMLFVRRDLLEDPAQRAAFRERFKRELKLPSTWSEYQQLVEFFNRPKEGFYGSSEPREKLTGWMFWMPRYLSTAASNQYLFDEQMHPLVDSPAGVAATESYVATVPYSPPQSLEDGKDYSYTLPFFVRGNAFATMLTVATAKISNRDDSAIKGKFIAVAMPGRVVGNRLVRRSQFIYGNNLVVPANAPNKALGLLFAMWLTDADNAARSVAANGIADPYRYSTLADERVRSLYTPQAMDLLRSELPFVAPSGTGLPGDSEYLGALSNNIWLAASGKLTSKEAMTKTAREWEAITDARGRAQQIAHWQAFKKLYPSATESPR